MIINQTIDVRQLTCAYLRQSLNFLTLMSRLGGRWIVVS